MAKQAKTLHKKSRGRQKGSGLYVETFPLRLTKEMKAAIDQWTKQQKKTRSEALRRLIELGLNAVKK
jgi:hypothetical protein